MFFKQIFEPKLAQYAYLIGCPQTGEALIVDPQRDIQRYIALAQENNLRITAATETHIHADYLSGLRQFAEAGVLVYASDEGDVDWKYEWLINSKYQHVLLKDGDQFSIGDLSLKALHTPGHTPEHLILAVTNDDTEKPDIVITGDFVFVGDVGRPDLLETAAGVVGSMDIGAAQMFDSLLRFKKLPGDWQLWPGHGAGSACGKALGAQPSSTIQQEINSNAAILASQDLQQFKDYILADQPEPPLYFARMKKDNRLGPAVLTAKPQPKLLTIDEFQKQGASSGNVILDTRPWDQFRAGHIKGSLFTPLNSAFNTIAGCYVPADANIYLLIEPDKLEEATNDLLRIGLDNIVGYTTPEDLATRAKEGFSLVITGQIATDEYEMLRKEVDSFALDVRRAEELINVGRIPGTHNIAHTRLLDRLAELPQDKTILVSCRSGVRSGYACALLERHGFTAVNVAGGYLSWLEKKPARTSNETS